MPKLPGMFDGSKYEDLRVLLPPSIRDYYEGKGTWDNIVLVKFYNECEVVWTQVTMGTSVSYLKHKWGYVEANGNLLKKRGITADDWQRDPPKGARLPK